MRGLSGKAILVAGGGNGIGAASALRLAQEGAEVAVGDLDLAAAQRTVEAIESAGGRAIALQYDQSNEDSIKELVSAAAERLGRLNGMHANAADLSPDVVGRDRQLLKMDVAVWMRTLTVNLVGYAIAIREVLPHLLSSDGGAIVCTSSAASELGQVSQPAYATSKAGVNALIRHTASRWGTQGVRANAVAPGIVLTETARKGQPESAIESLREGTRSTRLGAPEDIAATVAFLMSDDAAWVNGQVWGVDGGLVLR